MVVIDFKISSTSAGIEGLKGLFVATASPCWFLQRSKSLSSREDQDEDLFLTVSVIAADFSSIEDFFMTEAGREVGADEEVWEVLGRADLLIRSSNIPKSLSLNYK